jgi:hypothetical protein
MTGYYYEIRLINQQGERVCNDEAVCVFQGYQDFVLAPESQAEDTVVIPRIRGLVTSAEVSLILVMTMESGEQNILPRETPRK